MKIELKNIKLNLEFSEETIMFKAELIIDGKKVGTCSNEGRGGCTHYHPYQGYASIIRDAELYCESLPDEKYVYNGKEYTIKRRLDFIIDKLVSEYSNMMEEKKFKKKLETNMKKGILYGDEKEYSIISWKNMTLEDMLNNPKGRRTIQITIMNLTKEGKNILNTNIPKEMFSMSL